MVLLPSPIPSAQPQCSKHQKLWKDFPISVSPLHLPLLISHCSCKPRNEESMCQVEIAGIYKEERLASHSPDGCLFAADWLTALGVYFSREERTRARWGQGHGRDAGFLADWRGTGEVREAWAFLLALCWKGQQKQEVRVWSWVGSEEANLVVERLLGALHQTLSRFLPHGWQRTSQLARNNNSSVSKHEDVYYFTLVPISWPKWRGVKLWNCWHVPSRPWVPWHRLSQSWERRRAFSRM